MHLPHSSFFFFLVFLVFFFFLSTIPHKMFNAPTKVLKHKYEVCFSTPELGNIKLCPSPFLLCYCGYACLLSSIHILSIHMHIIIILEYSCFCGLFSQQHLSLVENQQSTTRLGYSILQKSPTTPHYNFSALKHAITVIFKTSKQQAYRMAPETGKVLTVYKSTS